MLNIHNIYNMLVYVYIIEGSPRANSWANYTLFHPKSGGKTAEVEGFFRVFSPLKSDMKSLRLTEAGTVSKILSSEGTNNVIFGSFLGHKKTLGSQLSK